jgi:hypothetical protein
MRKKTRPRGSGRPAGRPRTRSEPPPGTCAGTNVRKYGWYDDCVHVCWLGDGRYVALLKPLAFHQTQGTRTWTAPPGTLTDGASIPKIFWSVIGGPFEGKYRDAAVNHDYECCVQRNAWYDVHRMFYDAMMTRGVEEWRAKLMYFAVFFFGPRWPKPARRPQRGFTEGDIARAAQLFKTRKRISLTEIEELTPAALSRQALRIPSHIEGAEMLDDSRKIRAVDRKPPCTTSECGLPAA